MEIVEINKSDHEIKRIEKNDLVPLKIDPVFDSIKDRIFANDSPTRASIAMKILEREE